MPKALHLTSHARADYESVPKFVSQLLVRQSAQTWTLIKGNHTLMVVGVLRPALVGQRPELWMLLCEEFKRDLKTNLMLVHDKVADLLELYPNVYVRIDSQFGAGRKFAKFMGFVPVNIPPERVNGREYLTYEVR